MNENLRNFILGTLTTILVIVVGTVLVIQLNLMNFIIFPFLIGLLLFGKPYTDLRLYMAEKKGDIK